MVGSTELINEYVNKYTDDLQKDLSSQSNYLSNINQKNNIIANKHEIQLNQLREIEDKEKLLLTRSRMLQIAQDRNTYKTKIIYTLIAIIFGLFILILFIYTLLKKK
jgi:hypothetical protein